MKIIAKRLKHGDVFIFGNKELVSISPFSGECICVTTRNFYINEPDKERLAYGYTNSTVIQIKPNDIVDLIENIE